MTNLTGEWTFGVTPIFLTLSWDTAGILQKQINGGTWEDMPLGNPFKDENVNSQDSYSYRVISNGEVISNTLSTTLRPDVIVTKGKGKNK